MTDPDAEIRRPRVEIIVAMDPDRVIGRDNGLPWHLPDDLRHFKRITGGHTVIMGRRTFESIGRPLPGRRNMVLTRRPDWRHPGIEAFPDLDSALSAAETGTAFVIGGASLFAEALPGASVLHLTQVLDRHRGDVRFPPVTGDWTLAWEERHEADDRHASPFLFQRWERRT